MDDLRSEIASYFGIIGIGRSPYSIPLIVRNGFDTLEKDWALKIFTGKTWQDVFKHLQDFKDELPPYGLEEWIVLEKEALNYYLRAYLEFLFDALNGIPPDVEFIAFFVAALYQVIHARKENPFSAEQTLLLKKVMVVIETHVKDQNRFSDHSHKWIMNNVEKFLSKLEKRESDI